MTSQTKERTSLDEPLRASEVYAARLQVTIEKRLGRTSPDWVEQIAASEPGDKPPRPTRPEMGSR